MKGSLVVAVMSVLAGSFAVLSAGVFWHYELTDSRVYHPSVLGLLHVVGALVTALAVVVAALTVAVLALAFVGWLFVELLGLV